MTLAWVGVPRAPLALPDGQWSPPRLHPLLTWELASNQQSLPSCGRYRPPRTSWLSPVPPSYSPSSRNSPRATDPP